LLLAVTVFARKRPVLLLMCPDTVALDIHLALLFGRAFGIVAIFAILAVHVAVNGCYAAENSRPGLRKLLPTA